MENEKIKETGSNGQIKELTAKKLFPQVRNLTFAKRFAEDVADNLHLAEDYLYCMRDPHGSILKIGSAVETIVRHIVIKEGLELSFRERGFLKELNFLRRRGYPIKIIQAMDNIRKKRNLANHENIAQEYDAKTCLKNAYKILFWCIERYQVGIPTGYVATGSVFE